MPKRALIAIAAVGLIGMTASGAWSQTPKDLKWGTPPVGTLRA